MKLISLQLLEVLVQCSSEQVCLQCKERWKRKIWSEAPTSWNYVKMAAGVFSPLFFCVVGCFTFAFTILLLFCVLLGYQTYCLSLFQAFPYIFFFISRAVLFGSCYFSATANLFLPASRGFFLVSLVACTKSSRLLYFA